MLGPKCDIYIYISKIYSDLCPTVHFLRLFFPAQLYGATRRHGAPLFSLEASLPQSPPSSQSPDVLRKSTPIMWGKTWYPLVI